MLPDVVCAALSIVIMMIAMVVSPKRVECPHGMHATGVKPSGSFMCEYDPVCHGDSRGHEPDIPCEQPGGKLRGQVYCTGGSLPIIDRNGRVVSCQHGWYQ